MIHLEAPRDFPDRYVVFVEAADFVVLVRRDFPTAILGLSE